MAITDSLYLYRPELNAIPKALCHCCGNYLHHRKLLSSPGCKESGSVHLLPTCIVGTNGDRTDNHTPCNNGDNNNNTNNPQHTERTISNHRIKSMNGDEDPFQLMNLFTVHSGNTNFGLVKIRRTYELVGCLLSDKYICCKHFESLKIFMEQLQTIVKHSEEEFDNKLKNLMSLSLDSLSEKIVATGLKCLSNVFKCSECDGKPVSELNINQVEDEICSHNCHHQSVPMECKKSQMYSCKPPGKSTKNLSVNVATSFWNHLPSHHEVDCHRLKEISSSLSTCQTCSSPTCILMSSSSLSSSSCSSSSSSSFSSSSDSSSSFSSPPLSSPVTHSTYASLSSTSLNDNQILKSNSTCDCQISHEFTKSVKFSKLKKVHKQSKEEKLLICPVKTSEEECKHRNGPPEKIITDHKIVPCIHANKSQTANNSQSCCPQQYLEQNNKSETSSNISLDEIYPYAVSRRPSVRDILRRKVKVSDHHHHHEDVNVSKQQQQPQQKYDFNEGQLVHYPKECPRLFGGSPNYCAVNNIPENMRTNFYISDDHFNCYQSNFCMNRTDYIFYENNLNMGVVAPPNLNPFTS